MALLLAVGLTACSADDETERGLLPEDSSNLKQRPPFSDDSQAQRLIIVEVEETPMTDTSAPEEEKMETRATATTTSTLAAFSMNYQQGNKYDFEKTGTEWSSFYWPGSVENNERIDFYAYTRGTFYYNSGNPYLTYTVEENASTQHDLLVAEHKQISYNEVKDSEGKAHVSLSFNHACAAVFFKVQITNTLKTKLGGDLTVNSIVLHNVKNSGDYYYGTKSWVVGKSSSYYTLTNSDIFVTTSYESLPCGHLFMIPQTSAANGTEGTYLEVKYTTSGAKTAYIPVQINWEAGKLYTISIRLGTKTILTE
jgi:hypothetical protein